jgi:predicted transcriptional regulator
MESLRSTRRCRRQARQRQVLELRTAGFTQPQIAEKLGVDQATVSRDLKEAFSAYAQELDEEKKHYARLDLRRLEAIIAAQWPAAEEGCTKAARVVLAALERRAKLLGLDAKQQVEVSLNNTTDELDPAVMENRLKALLDNSTSN